MGQGFPGGHLYWNGVFKNKFKNQRYSRKGDYYVTENLLRSQQKHLEQKQKALQRTLLLQRIFMQIPDLFELAMALEEEFGVEIPSEDLEKITTVGAAAAYLEENK